MSNDKDNKKKERADKYEEKVKFDGTFEEMVGMSFGGKKEEKDMIELHFAFEEKEYSFKYRTEERIEGEGRGRVEWKDYYITFEDKRQGINIKNELLQSTKGKGSWVKDGNIDAPIDLLSKISSNIYKFENGGNSE
ncbi:MAG: hypothetical protein R2800_03960 [Flavipsychrobacter sp.]